MTWHQKTRSINDIVVSVVVKQLLPELYEPWLGCFENRSQAMKSTLQTYNKSITTSMLTCLAILISLFSFGLVGAHEFLEQPEYQAEDDQAALEIIDQVGGISSALAIEGDQAYLGIGPRLTVFDISDPTNPRLVGRSHALIDVVTDITVDGDTAYVLTTLDGVHIFDVSTPTEPNEIGHYISPYAAMLADLSVEGGLLKAVAFDLPTENAVLMALDVSDPSKPLELGKYQTQGRPNCSTVPEIRCVVWEENRAYFSTEGAVHIVDFASPSAPAEVAKPAMNLDWGVYGAESTIIYGTDEGKLVLVDTQRPESPIIIGTYPLPGRLTSVAVAGNWIFVSGYSDNAESEDAAFFCLFDSSQPGALAERSCQLIDSPASRIIVKGDVAYLADLLGGLRLVDISNPDAPNETGRYSAISHPAYDLVVDGTRAYSTLPGYARKDHRINILDLSQPGEPQQIASIELPEEIGELWTVFGDTVYFADREWLNLINVSDPDRPVRIDTFLLPCSLAQVTAEGGRVYLIDGEWPSFESCGFRVLDTGDPSQTRQVGYLRPSGSSSASDLTVSEGIAFVGLSDGGVILVDVSDTANPKEVGRFATGSWPRIVTIEGNLAYVQDNESDLQLVDFSNPVKPTKLASIKIEGHVVAVEDGIALVGNVDSATSKLSYQLFEVQGSAATARTGQFELFDIWGNTPRVDNAKLLDELVYVFGTGSGLYVLGQPTEGAPPSGESAPEVPPATPASTTMSGVEAGSTDSQPLTEASPSAMPTMAPAAGTPVDKGNPRTSTLLVVVSVLGLGLVALAVVILLFLRSSRKPAEIKPQSAAKTPAEVQRAYCPYCGAAYPATGNYCIKCGRERER